MKSKYTRSTNELKIALTILAVLIGVGMASVEILAAPGGDRPSESLSVNFQKKDAPAPTPGANSGKAAPVPNSTNTKPPESFPGAPSRGKTASSK